MTVTIHPGAMLVGKTWIHIDSHVIIDSYTFLAASEQSPIYIGKYCHVAAFVSIAGGPVTLEDYCNVGAGSRLVAGSDDFRASLIGPTIPAQFRNVNREGIVLKRHATLGANCVVLPGITMAEGSMGGAATLIRKNTEPWGIYAGTPARRIGTRDKDLCLYFESLLENS